MMSPGLAEKWVRRSYQVAALMTGSKSWDKLGLNHRVWQRKIQEFSSKMIYFIDFSEGSCENPHLKMSGDEAFLASPR